MFNFHFSLKGRAATCMPNPNVKILALIAFFCLSVTTWGQQDLPFNPRITCINPGPSGGGDEVTLCDSLPFTDAAADLVLPLDPAQPITLTSQLPTFWINDKIVISGTLIVDDIIYFIGSNIRLAPNAKIIVLEGKRLLLYRSALFACADLWDGIYVEKNARLVMFRNQIEDAKYAVQMEDGAVAQIVDNTFNRNFVGINNVTANAAGATINLTNFSGNVFSCSSDLNASFAGHLSDPVDQSYAGIYLNQCVADVGSPEDGNVFTGMLNGIVSVESCLMLQGGTFSDFSFVGEVSDSGYGLQSIGGQLYVNESMAGVSTGTASSFTDCTIGIYGHGADMRVADVTTAGQMEFGIESFGNTFFQEVIIHDNHILNDDIIGGIAVERSVASGNTTHNQIYNNEVVIPASTGIAALSNFPSSDQMLIEYNHVTLTENGVSGTAINIDSWGGAYNTRVLDNNIQLGTGGPIVDVMHGIEASSYFFPGGNEISGNDINGVFDATRASVAIKLLNAQGFQLCDNTTDSTYYGLLFLGNNDHTALQNNKIGDHFFGLGVGSAFDPNAPSGTPARIGSQIRRGNLWLGTYGGAGAILGNNSRRDRSQFIVESASAPFFPPSIISASASWFIPEAGDTDYCTSGGGLGGGVAVGLSDWEMDVVTGVVNEATDGEIAVWDGKVGIMYKLYDDPQLRTQHPAIEAFFQFNKNKQEGKFARWEQRIKLALQTELSYDTSKDNLSDELTQEVQALQQLIANYQPVSDTIIDEAYVASRQAYLDVIRTKHSAILALEQTVKQNRQVALSLIPRPTPTSAKATRHAVVLDFVMELLVGEATEADWENFWAYARTLSEADGRVARWARSLLPHCEQNNFTANALVSQQNEINKPETQVMSVYPNPASDRIQIDLPAGGGQLRCIDLLGRVVYEQQFTESDVPTLELDLSLQAPGTYWVHYLGADGEQYQRMFIKE